jgi:DNA-directed RNA polymerase subunit beta'
VTTTVGKVLLKEHLPPAYRDRIDKADLDQKGISALFEDLAKEHPAEYPKIVADLARLGFEVSTRMGSSVSLSALRSPIDRDKAFGRLNREVAEVRKKHGEPKGLKAQEALRHEVAGVYQKFIKDVSRELVDEGVKQGHTLAKIVKAGARGSPAQLMQTIFSPVLVQDAHGRPQVDFPIQKSYAEGLNLPEYLAASYGARAGEVAKKQSVPDSGYFSKQLSRAMMTVKVEEHDCGTETGVDRPVDNREILGTFLARPAGKFKRNNEVTSAMLNSLAADGIDHVVVRSPMTCQASRRHHDRAVCQLCAGRRESGLPQVGSFIGVTSATSMGEPLAQSQLNVKHSGGGASGGPSISTGFPLIRQLATIPSTFKDRAAMAEREGRVDLIRPAPQGGHYVVIGPDEHYVPTGFKVLVKEKDLVEPGDVLSEGVVNPADVARLKGIGEGRKYFADRMKQAFEDGGMSGVNIRNFETLAKAAIDHVRITHHDGVGTHLPGQVVSYQAVERDWEPRPDAVRARIDQAAGLYLEEPVLHYTIGTLVTRRIAEHLRSRGVTSVLASRQPPPFVPEMQRIDAIPEHEPDWMHQLYTSHLERKLLHAANTGAFSDLKGPSPIPGLAHGVGFGQPAVR